MTDKRDGLFCRLLALLLAVGCAGEKKPVEPEFLAGVGVVEITPTREIPLGGYGGRKGKPLTGVHDPLYAKALWLETPSAKICLVTADLVGTSLELRNAIRPEGVPLILAASHTHSGPGGLARNPLWWPAMGKFDAALHEELAGKLRRAVDMARASRRPARLAFARGEAPALARNRRSRDEPVDPEILVLLVTDEVSRPLAVLTNYAAHPTVLSDDNFLISADWPGAFQRALEARMPGVALFVNGAEGDVSPRAPGGRDDFEKCESFGGTMADKVDILLRDIDKTKSQVTINYVERGVELPSPTLPFVPTRSVLGVLDINGTKMFCFPGEPTAQLGLAIKRRFPGSWVLGLANDHLGYFLTEEQYRKGGYERRVSFYGPGMGPWLIDRFCELGEGDHAQDRSGESKGGRGEDHDGG